MREAYAGPAGMRPRIFIFRDTHLFRLKLSNLLEGSGFEVQRCSPAADIEEALANLRGKADLLIMPVDPSDPATFRALEVTSRHPKTHRVPVLGLTTLSREGLDIARLRILRVIGLIDKRWIPEQIVARVHQAVSPHNEERRYSRAAVFMPVDIRTENFRSTEYALDLSVGGMRLTCSQQLPTNTDLSVSFEIERDEKIWIDVSARVMHCGRSRSGSVPYEIGIFFYPLPGDVAESIDRYVECLLETQNTF